MTKPNNSLEHPSGGAGPGILRQKQAIIVIRDSGIAVEEASPGRSARSRYAAFHDRLVVRKIGESDQMRFPHVVDMEFDLASVETSPLEGG